MRYAFQAEQPSPIDVKFEFLNKADTNTDALKVDAANYGQQSYDKI